MLTLNPTDATLTTVGAGTLTAAILAAGSVRRSGPTGDFADTFDTAALIAALLQMPGGASWRFTYVNTTAHVATLTASTGVTLAGASAAIPAASVAECLISLSVAGAVVVTVLYRVEYV